MPTILPGRKPNVEIATADDRWKPNMRVEREIDRTSAQSAFPAARRFETIYPGTPASREATAQMHRAREHDRIALRHFVDLLKNEPE